MMVANVLRLGLVGLTALGGLGLCADRGEAACRRARAWHYAGAAIHYVFPPPIVEYIGPEQPVIVNLPGRRPAVRYRLPCFLCDGRMS